MCESQLISFITFSHLFNCVCIYGGVMQSIWNPNSLSLLHIKATISRDRMRGASHCVACLVVLKQCPKSIN
jgi:hypothetical protein